MPNDQSVHVAAAAALRRLLAAPERQTASVRLADHHGPGADSVHVAVASGASGMLVWGRLSADRTARDDAGNVLGRFVTVGPGRVYRYRGTRGQDYLFVVSDGVVRMVSAREAGRIMGAGRAGAAPGKPWGGHETQVYPDRS